MKQTFGRGYPTLYHSILYYFLSIASIFRSNFLLLCQHFALCYYFPIIPITLPAKSAHSYWWVVAIRREGQQPNEHLQICQKHFIKSTLVH